MRELVVAFAGAAIAFVFFLLGEALLKAYDRSKSHYDGLVSLERVLNLQLDEISVVGFQMRTLRQHLEKGRVLIDLPRSITKPEGMFLELFDIDLVNRLLSAGVLLRRANNDIENLREAYSRLFEGYLDQTLPREAYVENGRFVVGGFEAVAAALEQYRQEAENILARVRLRLAAGTPRTHRLVRWLISHLMVNTATLPDDKVQAELTRLAEEVEIVRRRSRDRIAEAQRSDDGA